jgi:hypothetical protein
LYFDIDDTFDHLDTQENKDGMETVSLNLLCVW